VTARPVRVNTGNAELQLKAAKLFAEHGAGVLEHLPAIGKSDG
jgi:hypothetical protein